MTTDHSPSLDEIRAPANAITYAWGLTEQQWLERVQAAERRADTAELLGAEFLTRAERAEELVRVLGEALERITHNFQQLVHRAPVRDVPETFAEANVALRAYRAFTEANPTPGAPADE